MCFKSQVLFSKFIIWSVNIVPSNAQRGIVRQKLKCMPFSHIHTLTNYLFLKAETPVSTSMTGSEKVVIVGLNNLTNYIILFTQVT